MTDARRISSRNYLVAPSGQVAHHVWYWSRGGPTDLDNLKLLCWQHHREIHIHDAKKRE